MIFIGVSEKVVRNTYRDYGFESLDDILFVEGNAKRTYRTRMGSFEMEIAERLSAYDSVAIAQMNAEEKTVVHMSRKLQSWFADIVPCRLSVPIIYSMTATSSSAEPSHF